MLARGAFLATFATFINMVAICQHCELKYSGANEIIYEVSCPLAKKSNLCCLLTSVDKIERFAWGMCRETSHFSNIDVEEKSASKGCHIKLKSKYEKEESMGFTIEAFEELANGTRKNQMQYTFSIYSKHCGIMQKLELQVAENITLLGNPSKTFQGVEDVAMCQASCNDSNCQYFTWNYVNRTCHVFKSEENVIGLCPMEGWISYKNEAWNNSTCPKLTIVFDDCLANNYSFSSMHGGKYEIYQNTTKVELCQERCSDVNCSYFVWNAKSQECELSLSTEPEFCPSEKGNTIVGDWNCLNLQFQGDNDSCESSIDFVNCQAFNYSLPEEAVKGHQEGISSLDFCQEKCMDSNCSYFVWDFWLRECVLSYDNSAQDACFVKTTRETVVGLGQKQCLQFEESGENSLNVLMYVLIPLFLVGSMLGVGGWWYHMIRKTSTSTFELRELTSDSLDQRQQSLLKLKTLTRVRLDDFVPMHSAELIPRREEFTILATLHVKYHIMKFSSEVAALYPDENRHGNVVPFDDNRVKLVQPVRGSNYINASWIQGQREIVTQGPLPNTIAHFLQMILEQNVEAIVMLTPTIELSRDGQMICKCEQYWPENPGEKLTFEHMEITNLSSQVNSNGVVERDLLILNLLANETQNVSMIHYLNWPDFSVPTDTKDLFDIAAILKQLNPFRIVVHCSAGIGRSGTFLALSRLMDQVDAKAQFIDVFDTVLALRRDRKSMVHKLEQYKFLFSAVAEYIKMTSDA